jgi:hypothetical protein
MYLHFLTPSLCDVYRMKLMMPEHKIISLSFTFQNGSDIVDVQLEITSVSKKEIDRYFNDLMKNTLTISIVEPPAKTLSNAFKFRADHFVDVKKWIHMMPSGLIRSVTIAMQPGAADLEILVDMSEGVNLDDMRTWLHWEEVDEALRGSVQRAQHYTGDQVDLVEIILKTEVEIFSFSLNTEKFLN